MYIYHALIRILVGVEILWEEEDFLFGFKRWHGWAVSKVLYFLFLNLARIWCVTIFPQTFCLAQHRTVLLWLCMFPRCFQWSATNCLKTEQSEYSLRHTFFMINFKKKYKKMGMISGNAYWRSVWLEIVCQGHGLCLLLEYHVCILCWS